METYEYPSTLDTKLKICFIGGTRYSQPLDATREKKFRKLLSIGELFVIAFSPDWSPRCFTQHAHFYLLPSLPLSILRYGLMLAVGSLLVVWLGLSKQVQIFVAQSPYEGFAAALAKMAMRALGKDAVLVVESHGDFEEALFLQRRVLLPRLYRSLMYWVARWSLQQADLLRAISSTTRQQLERWMRNQQGAIVQFPTYTDIERFLKAPGVVRDRADILYVGVLTPLKGVHFLIEAFEQIVPKFPEASLKIIGRAENPTYSEELRRLTSRLSLTKRTIFLDEMPQEDLVHHMCSCCVLVLPSTSEGLGRVLIEAMACGRPVIGSNVGGIPEVIRDGVTGFLIPPGDVEALAQRLAWILERPEEAREMGERGCKFVQEFFSTETYVQNYAKLLSMAEQLLRE